MTRRNLAGQLAAALLLASSVVLVWTSLAGIPELGDTLGVGLFASATLAIVDLHVRPRRFGTAFVVVLLFAIADGLADQAGVDGRPWALPIALSGYLLWVGFARNARAVAVSLTPALGALGLALARHGTPTEPMVMSLALLPAAIAATAIGVARARSASRAAVLRQHQSDLDAVVMANLELRHVGEAREAADRIARIAGDLLSAEGAVVWVRGPGRLLCAGGHGVTPSPDREVITGSSVDDVLVSGVVASNADEVVIPLTGSGGVFGAVAVSRPSRAADAHVLSVLRVFGAQAGYTLERLRAVESLIDARYVDPVTGVGNQLAATASLATLHPGDAILLLAVDELLTIRAIDGDARADLLLGQLGLHLRTAVRAGDVVARHGDDVFFVVLRALSSSTESVVDRLLESWDTSGTAGRLRAGAAMHFDDTTPLDTLDRATEALDASRTDPSETIDLADERVVRERA